jgi:hypothetical protein
LLTVAASAVAAVAIAGVGYRVWRDFSAPSPALSSASVAPQGSAVPAAGPRPAPSATSSAHAPAAKAAAATAAAASSPPAFDVVRVEPSGDSVVAGRGAPHAKVTLLDNGKPLAAVETDDNGQFAMTPPALRAGNHQLSLSMSVGAQATPSAQSVTVIVPKGKSGRLVVALVAPGQATRILADEPAAAAGAGGADQPQNLVASAPAKKAAGPANKGQVFIRTVEVGQ